MLPLEPTEFGDPWVVLEREMKGGVMTKASEGMKDENQGSLHKRGR